MLEEEFVSWMERTGRKAGAKRATQIGDLKKIDKVFDDIDKQYEKDCLQGVIKSLSYTKEDVVSKREYYSEMQFTPKVPRSDETYFQRLYKIFYNSRKLVERYRRFRDETSNVVGVIRATASDG